jgi:hypothetical protein
MSRADAVADQISPPLLVLNPTVKQLCPHLDDDVELSYVQRRLLSET